MIFFIYGTDAYRISEKLSELKSGFMAKKDKAGINVVKLEGAKIEMDRFKQEALTVPFLSDAKLIIIDGLTSLAGVGAKKTREQIYEFIRAKHDKLENNLIFTDVFENSKYLPAKDSLFGFLKKQKYSWEINLLTPRELPRWIADYAKQKNIPIETAAINELALLVGSNLFEITLEISKLAAYKNGAPIDVAAVKELVKAKFTDNIFLLTDALGTKDKKISIKLITNQLKSGEAPLALLYSLISHFNNLIRVKALSEAGQSNKAAIAKELGLHEYVTQKALAQSRNFSEAELKIIYNELSSMDSAFKSGAKNPELLFDLFVAKYI